MITYIIVYKNTSDLTKFTIRSIEKFSALSHKLLLMNTGKVDDFLQQYKNNAKIVSCPPVSDPRLVHGYALNKAMPHVKTKYACALDSDSAFTSERFDKKIVEQLGDKIKLVAAHPRKTLPGKPKTNHADLMFFETKIYKKLGIDFMPKFSLGLDTGGSFAWKLIENGLEVKYLDKVPRGYRIRGMCKQYELDGERIFTHMGRGTNKAVSAKKGGYKARKKKWTKALKSIL